MSHPSPDLLRFALNHMVCPSLTPLALLDAAASLNLNAVELRNDIGDNSLTDLNQAKAVGARAAEMGIEVLSVNALYPFNIWNDERAAQAELLARLAAACGAKALVMCPLNEGTQVEPNAGKSAELSRALQALNIILQKHGLLGYVEPLGFPVSSLRFKQEALEAIDAIGGADRFKLVHDTFHHRGANEQQLFPLRTGLVHISGIEDPNLSFSDMLDGDRVLVGPADRLGNIEQLQQLLVAGYRGPVSFEPFSEAVWSLTDPLCAVKESMEYIRSALSHC
ncbi:predicted sugar epimerase [Hahella chejuensis KCTC 2396]|uniref:Predicted sugar epimerase n=1 Tax=Hahella chejuensis (strain KCTC 2396) TaxID=349521 RepID=Q2SMT5_HAHCH|nr:TIM barrel protein [Hahella chejuensis]ABC28039.1 predicted sugar epimerase [Hahella chejuensis KCTC 2396]